MCLQVVMQSVNAHDPVHNMMMYMMIWRIALTVYPYYSGNTHFKIKLN